MGELARQAQYKLAYEHEIFSELVMPTLLSPFETSPLEESVQRTGRLLTIEEGTLSLGWGAEIAARIVSVLPGTKIARLAAAETPVPASQVLEKSTLPQVEDIVSFVQKMV
jgi:pyruvate/2-oxoglutarate/acetoin dehydrogenase E1 component